MKPFLNKRILIYLIKFIGAFCFFYFGTLAVIGLSAPVGYYSAFVDHYLNFIPAFRATLLYGTKAFVYLLGYETFIPVNTQIRMVNGSAVNLVYSCLGYGVTSFWLAFIFANTGSLKKKLVWMLGGTIIIWIINVLRISMVLMANSKKWTIPFGMDNHTLFNIAAYIAIFVMIYFFDRSEKNKPVVY